MSVFCANAFCSGFNADIWEVLIGSICRVIEIHKGTVSSVKKHSGGDDDDDMMDLDLGFSWDIEMD